MTTRIGTWLAVAAGAALAVALGSCGGGSGGDGGVTPETAPLVVAAGADVLVAGSSVFMGGSVADPAPYAANIAALRASIA